MTRTMMFGWQCWPVSPGLKQSKRIRAVDKNPHAIMELNTIKKMFNKVNLLSKESRWAKETAKSRHQK